MSKKASVIIRETDDSDRDFLYEMLYQSIYVAPGEALPSRDVLKLPRIRRYVENWGRDGDHGLVAIEENPGGELRRVGALWLRFFPADYPGYGFIHESIPEIGIAVIPEQRGRGVGTQLLKSLLIRPRIQYPAISLSVDPENPAADLYRRLGFVECGGSGTSLIMRYDFPVIREALQEDLPRLTQIYLDSRIHLYYWLDPKTFSLSDFPKDTEGERILVAELRGDIVGFSSSWEPDNFIHSLYLDPREIGRGIGGKLLDATVDILKKPIRLKAQVKNTQAMWFYRQRGWEELSRGVTDWGEYVELILR